MKPRVKLSLRFATQAHAETALTRVTTFLDGKDVVFVGAPSSGTPPPPTAIEDDDIPFS